MYYVGVWLACAVTAAIIAGARGANKGRAFGFGFLLGPFGVLLALVLPVEKSAPELLAEYAKNAGPQRSCPFCYSQIPAIASVCRECKRESAPTVEELAPGFPARCFDDRPHKLVRSKLRKGFDACSRCKAYVSHDTVAQLAGSI